jgi:hypothetical protein
MNMKENTETERKRRRNDINIETSNTTQADVQQEFENEIKFRKYKLFNVGRVAQSV